MKIIKLHCKTTSIVYKNSLCSLASLTVFIIFLATIIVPLFLVSWMAPYSGGDSETKILFEQPKIKFQYKFILIGNGDEDETTIACSSFSYFNIITNKYQKCKGIKYWENDINYDQKVDKANFEIAIDLDEINKLKSIYLVLFFETILQQHKCILKPTSVIIQHIEIPEMTSPGGLSIIINSRLKLIQNMQFICPYFGRTLKSHFPNEILGINNTHANSFDIIKLKETNSNNLGFFEAKPFETYFQKQKKNVLQINFSLSIFEIPVRYYLSIWERLGLFWLHFLSFFIITQYLANKIKNFLFSRHILRSWENIPWKKLY